MGISNLLPHLASITETRPLSFYRGKRAAIDILCWLHKGSRSCAREMALYNDYSRLTDYCLSRLQELIQNGITPYVVFDGADLPIKQNTNDHRKAIRLDNKNMAELAEKQGDIIKANEYYYKAIEIIPDMYVPLIQQLRKLNIKYIIAPYEADAQIGYLYRNNYVDFVITEDGDSLVYGCRCVLFKLDGGIGQEIDMNRLSQCTEFDFCGWTHDMFTYMCILCGCDYLKSLHRIGITSAYNAVNLGRKPSEIFSQLRMKTTITNDYENGFLQAVFTFRHQTIIDPQTLTTLPLMPYPPSICNNPPSYLGPLLPPEIASLVATGSIHPMTHEPFVNEIDNSMEEEIIDCNQENTSLLKTTKNITNTPFTSPFISISFKALIEKPSQRGISMNMYSKPYESSFPSYSSNQVNSDSFTSINKYGKRNVIMESPPRKRPLIQRVGESPIFNRHINSFLDQFRDTLRNT